jgi:hypothetical protein
MAQTLKLLAEKFEQVIKQQRLSESNYFVPQDVPEAQGKAIDSLMARGYRFNNWIKPGNHGDEEAGLGCAMLQKSKKFTHSFVEVDPDGSCNGEPLKVYLDNLKKLNEVENPGAVSDEDKVLQAANEYVKSLSSMDYSDLTDPESIYGVAFEVTHEDMVDNSDMMHLQKHCRIPFSDMMDDDMTDAVLDSNEVAEKACDGIAEYMGGKQYFDIVYDIARPHMPN